MSRSGYSEDIDNWALIRWRGRVASSTRGKRGQKLLRELAEAMDAMPEKRLIKNELKRGNEYCALGVIGKKRGIPLEDLDPHEYNDIAKALDVAAPLAQEVVYLNDEACSCLTPEERWEYMRGWLAGKIKN